MQCFVEGVDGGVTVACPVLEELLAVGAVEGSQRVHRCADDAQVASLTALACDGSVAEVELNGVVGWQLTQGGLHKLRFYTELDPGVPALEPRGDLQLEDRTSWETVCTLLDSGWTWQAMPTARGARLALPPFDVASQQPKVVYSGWCLVD